MNRLSFRALGACLALACTGLAAQAQDIEELVVTATKRGETIREVPFSVGALSEDDIQRLGIESIEELARNVAGLTIQDLGPGQSQVSVRGMSAGQIVRDQPGVKEQVGIYLDESIVSLSLFTPDFDLYDLDRVEVLRGPQGTLFGAGSIGGTIRYITNQPEIGITEGSMEFAINTVTQGGEGGHIKGMFNLPIGENTALRLVGYSTDYAGYIDALRMEPGEERDDPPQIKRDVDVNSGSRRGMRASLRWQPSEYLTVTPRLIFQKVGADGFNREEAFNVLGSPYTRPSVRPRVHLGRREQFLLLDEGFEDETLLFDVTLEFSFDTFDLTSITSLLDRELLVSRDASALANSVSISFFQDLEDDFPAPEYDSDDESKFLPPEYYAVPANLVDTTDLRQFTQELRLSSNADESLQWVAGIFFSQTDREYGQRLPIPAYGDVPGYDEVTRKYSILAPPVINFHLNRPNDLRNGFEELDHPYISEVPYDISQIAAFGEVTKHIDDRLSLTVGYRWYRFTEDRSFRSGGWFSTFTTKEEETRSTGISPRILTAFRISENITVNLQASKGFRFGGSNDPLNRTLCDLSPGTYDIYSQYEGSYMDETMWNYETGFKAAWGNGMRLNFSIYRSDIQDLQVNLDAGDCSSRVTLNVPEAHATGWEAELTAAPREGLDLRLAVSKQESEFDSQVPGKNGPILARIDGIEDGNRLASVPEFQVAATAHYTWPVQWLGGSDVYLSASVQHVGSRITQPGDQVHTGTYVSRLPYAGATGGAEEATQLNLMLPSYTITNLKFGLLASDWEASLYINNATDVQAHLSFDRERGGRARLGFRTNQPRTIGLLFRKYFQ